MNTLTELEDRLAAPDGGALRDQLMRQMKDTEVRLAGQASRPLPREEFAAVNACLRGTEAAQRVLGRWITGTANHFPTTGRGVARNQ